MNIKKLILAAFVVMTFVGYSFNQRSDTIATVFSKTSGRPAASGSPAGSRSTTASSTTYKDGVYIGNAADALYGYIQVKATVIGGKLADIVFLQYPNDRRNSVDINTQAMPMLKQQALQTQSSQVDGVSGATDTTQAFIQSLGNALLQAKA